MSPSYSVAWTRARHTIKGFHHLKTLLALALLFTILNALKPICIDDALYYYRARQVAEHPLDPYGFNIFWNDSPEPAIQVLAPPLFPYYWAIAIRLFGERPFLWKLWLLPLSLMLIFSLHALLRRFAPGHELWMTWMTIISPVFLPGFNLMLEVPVAALSLLALNLFLRACDRESFAWAALAGLVNGLAMETKYTAFVTAGVILLYALIFKRLRLGMLAASLGVLLFASLEGLTAWRYGHSHFLYQSGVYGSVNLFKKYLYLAGPLITLMGAVAPALALLGLTTLKVRGRFIVLAAALVVLGYLTLAFVPEQYQVITRAPGTSEEWRTLTHIIFGIFGVVVYGTLGIVIWRLCGLSPDWRSYLKRWRDYRVEWFLVLWLLLEIAGYFALSPIPAVRRLPGLLIASTLLISRLATQICRGAQCRQQLRAVVIGSMALGLLFYVVDLHDAAAEKTAAERTAQKIAETGSSGNVWYVGRWGFQYYAERLGMKPVVPDESDFHEGDWLVVPDSPYFPQPVSAHINRYRIELVAHLSVEDSLPLATMMGYYNSGTPLKHHEGPRRTVKLYRLHLAVTPLE
jgi:hypothetical protein